MKTSIIWIVVASFCLMGIVPVKAQETAGAADPMSSVFGADLFKLIEFEKLEYDSSGAHLRGRVVLKGDDFQIQANEVKANAETKILKAKGRPVRIQQGEVRATCNNLTYNIDKKTSRLEGKPVIRQKAGNKTSELSADVITIRQDKNGEPSIMAEMLPGSNRIPMWRIVESPPPVKADDKEKSKAKKVDPAKPNVIKLPKLPDVAGANP